MMSVEVSTLSVNLRFPEELSALAGQGRTWSAREKVDTLKKPSLHGAKVAMRWSEN